jgi:hypothetical protein
LFASSCFHESVSPQPQSIPLGPFQIFSQIRGDIRSSRLPPVSTTQVKLVAKFAAGVVDTAGKFAAGVVDTGGNLPPVSTSFIEFYCFLCFVSIYHTEEGD